MAPPPHNGMLTTPNLRQVCGCYHRAQKCQGYVMPRTQCSWHSIPTTSSQHSAVTPSALGWVLSCYSYSFPLQKEAAWTRAYTAAPTYACSHSPAVTLLTLVPLTYLIYACQKKSSAPLCLFGFKPLTSSTFVSSVYLVAMTCVCHVSLFSSTIVASEALQHWGLGLEMSPSRCTSVKLSLKPVPTLEASLPPSASPPSA